MLLWFSIDVELEVPYTRGPLTLLGSEIEHETLSFQAMELSNNIE